MNKKNSCVGVTSGYHGVAENSRIPKMPYINHLQALVHPQTQRNYPAWIVNLQPQLLRIRLFGKYICRLGTVDSNLPSNWWVSLLQKSEFAVLFLGFEKLGLELDNCGWTTKNAYCRIYSLWCVTPRYAHQKRKGSAQWSDDKIHLLGIDDGEERVEAVERYGPRMNARGAASTEDEVFV
jgi:hypothetical protein